MKKYKVIIFDLDGTLLNQHGKISNDFKNWINHYQKSGGNIIFASGRKKGDMYNYIDETGLLRDGSLFVISCDGLYISSFEKWKEMNFECIGKPLALDIIDYTFKSRLHKKLIIVTPRNNLIVNKSNPIINYIKNIILTFMYKNYRFVSKHDLCKVDFVAEKIIIKGARNAYIESITNSIRDIKYYYCNKSQYEIMPQNVDKYHAIRKILDILNIAQDECLFFGDDENDLMCFYNLKNTVAMGNAIDEVKRVARFATFTNKENGVYRFLITNVYNQ